MLSIGTILLVVGGIIIAWSIKEVIEIFVSDWRYYEKIENQNFQRGKNMSKQELENEIAIISNIKVKSGQRLEIFSKMQGLEKALREKS